MRAKGIEAASWIRRKQREAEMTEQEVTDCSEGRRVSRGAKSRWTSLRPWNLAQSKCTNTVRCLAEKLKDKGTAESSESGGGSRGGEGWAGFRCPDLLGPEAGQPYPRGVRGGSHVLPAGRYLSAQVPVPKARHWKSAGHWHQWPDNDGQSWTALSAAAGGGSG